MALREANKLNRPLAVYSLGPVFWLGLGVLVAGAVVVRADLYAALGWALAAGLWYAYGRAQLALATLERAVVLLAYSAPKAPADGTPKP